jgi:hypothetical protein
MIGTVAVLGLGEGRVAVRRGPDRARGSVSGYDPDPHAARELAAGRAGGLRRAATRAESVTGAGIDRPQCLRS